MYKAKETLFDSEVITVQKCLVLYQRCKLKKIEIRQINNLPSWPQKKVVNSWAIQIKLHKWVKYLMKFPLPSKNIKIGLS